MTTLPSPSAKSALTLGLSLLALTGCGSEPGAEPGGEAVVQQRPDVIVIVIDTLRSDHLGSYGYARETSPFLDRLAQEGVVFEDTTAQGAWTLPSMVSMFTGKYLTDWLDRVPSEQAYMPQIFKQSGYQTIGLSANILVSPTGGFARGFDFFDCGISPRMPGEPEVRYQERNLTDLATAMWEPLDAALSLDANGERDPVFLYLQPFEPHAPYKEHNQLNELLPLRTLGHVQPRGWQQEVMLAQGAAPPAKDPKWNANLNHIRRLRGSYDKEIRFLDQQLEVMFNEFGARDLFDNSIVVVLSDHGECLWERPVLKTAEELSELGPLYFFYKEHGSYLYEEAVGTPLIMVGKGLPAGKRVSQAVENIDLFPTLLELCDLALPEGLHGESLVELARSGAAFERDYVFANALPCSMVREVSTGLKLIVPREAGGRFPDRDPELYDLNNDPKERTNLALERPDDLARLQAKLEAWRLEYPTESNFGVPVSKAQSKRLRGLGYTGDSTRR